MSTVQDVHRRLGPLWSLVVERSEWQAGSPIHGEYHWRRVERNGLYIAERTGADAAVISLFALFHDCRRESDGTDHGHGARGAAFAESMREETAFLDDARFEMLVEACRGHTGRVHHDDPTIAACWDADRLDLVRIGVPPNSAYLNTDPAKELADSGDLGALGGVPLREIF